MAERDWYGPFTGLAGRILKFAERYFSILLLVGLGGYLLYAGLVGYDAMGRRDVRISRWVSAPIWFEVIVGAGVLLVGIFKFWKLPPRPV